MLDAAEEATSFIEGKTRADLEENRMLTLALVRSIEIIGEAGANVSGAGRAETPKIPWRQIVAMRNRLIHAYFDVNLDILWETVESDLPPLTSTLRRVLAEGNTIDRSK
ncbi:DUF86 domain-containing protein [soil metagenome]|jgi:uncharacterized protein with HEPN domain